MKILVVIDCQRDFISGALANKEAERRVPRIVEKIKQRQKEGWKILFTKDTHYSNYLYTLEGKNLPVPHCIEGTEGWLIAPEICEAIEGEDYKILNKSTFGAMNIGNIINGMIEEGDTLKEIEVIGFISSICVAANSIILRATYPNIPISVDASCCAGLTKEDHDAALLTMKQQQITITGEEI